MTKSPADHPVPKRSGVVRKPGRYKSKKGNPTKGGKIFGNWYKSKRGGK